MPHDHNHSHQFEVTNLNKAFIIGIALNVTFVIVEFTAGFWYNSLGLISDAGHNLSDVASLVLAMLAFRLAKVNPTPKYTYGYKKSTILISLLNGLILLVAVGFILGESIEKLFNPSPVDGNAVIWVAGVGIVINALTAWMFMKDKEKDLNVKAAYLHMMADALVSVGVVVAGIVIKYTDWNAIDAIVGILIAVVIVISTWRLLWDSLRLSLDGVPNGISYDKIGEIITDTSGVKSFHHMHIWALSTTEIAMTVHVVIEHIEKMEELKCNLKNRLKEASITHLTLEIEVEGKGCIDNCNEKLVGSLVLD